MKSEYKPRRVSSRKSKSNFFSKNNRSSTTRRALGSIFAVLMNVLMWLGKKMKQVIKWVFSSKGLWRKIFRFGIIAGIILFIFVSSLFVYYSFQVPNPNQLVNRKIPESTKIFDRDGELLYEVFGEAKRTLVKIEDVPEQVKNATIAVEDQNFYEHGGIDMKGIARAVLANIFSGFKSQGGSTITQQFVKNAILTNEKTFARKIKEAILAIQLENRLSKEQILQLYMNEVPYGSNSFGIQAASKTFFNKKVQDLSLTETAYLASLPNAPTFYSPYGPNREELDARADIVLQLMYEQGYITEDERNRAQNQEVEFKQISSGIEAPHFVLYVQDLLAKKYGELGLREGGFNVTTSLDLDLQKKAEQAVANHAERIQQQYNASNASLVAIDPKTGQILAMVGSKDYFDEEIDGAVNVALRPRQPGSSFKPYVYATAFLEGMNPATMLMDVVTNFGKFGGQSYIPRNYDNAQRGPVSIRTALQGSLNIPAVKTLILVGTNDAIDTAESLGINTLKDRSRYGPSLVLGGGEVKLLEHVSAYGVFANGGVRHEPVSILKVEDSEGNTLEEWKESRGREVLNAQAAYQISHVLSDNNARAFAFGANNSLTLGNRPVAAKTGTTQESKDAWTVGYTPSLVAGVWAGNNKPEPMRAGGSTVAGPIWNEFMRSALADQPVEGFVRPKGITQAEVDALSGMLPGPYTQNTKTEVFAEFNLPKEIDNTHVPVVVGGETRIYTVLHSKMPDNPNWEQPVRRWAENNGYPLPPTEGDTDVPGMEIDIVKPDEISALPWSANIAVQTNEQVERIDLYLDNNLIVSETRQAFSFNSSFSHVDGTHQLIVQVKTADGGVSQKTTDLKFNLGVDVQVLSPASGQTLSLPQNLTIESNQDTDPGNVSFQLTSASSGETQTLSGQISKQRLTNDVYYYTLGINQQNKPGSGTYSLTGTVNNKTTNQINITIP